MGTQKDTGKAQNSAAESRKCAYRFCGKPLPLPARNSGQPRRFCDGSCRKAEWSLRLRDEEIRREEEARQRREQMWATLLPDTRKVLQRILLYSGEEVAMQVTEAITAEIARARQK